MRFVLGNEPEEKTIILKMEIDSDGEVRVRANGETIGWFKKSGKFARKEHVGNQHGLALDNFGQIIVI